METFFVTKVSNNLFGLLSEKAVQTTVGIRLLPVASHMGFSLPLIFIMYSE